MRRSDGLSLRDNLDAVRRRIAESARRVGRDPGAVTLVAVSKGQPPERVREALAAGVRCLGENRVAELVDKHAALGPGPEWHFVGRLQTNKVRTLLRAVPVRLVHSLDRPALAEALDREARRLGRVQPVLVQVNVSGEPTKAGLPPAEVVPFLRWVAALPGLEVQGLMTMAPPVRDPEEARPVFRRLRELLEEARRAGIPGLRMEHLSMGMSGDYQVAVEEGATLVRVGTAIFGEVGGNVG